MTFCDKLGPWTLGERDFCLNLDGHAGECRWRAESPRRAEERRIAPAWMTAENLDAWNEACAVPRCAA